MKILKPCKNKVTQGYSTSHKGYDFSGKGDTNAYAAIYGKVVQSKNSELRNWVAFQSGDPYKDTRKGKLINEDYGNYCKISGEVDGVKFYVLYAHLEAGSVAPVGTEVKAGQVIGKIGNTGNSTGAHLHFELRDANNVNIPAEFTDEPTQPIMDTQTKEQIIIDAYKAETGAFPTDDEKKWRLQQNLNTIQLIESLHDDKRFFDKWVAPHVPTQDINWHETALLYQETFEKLKEIFSLPPADNTEEVLGKARNLIAELDELKKLQEPKTIYKYADKDFQAVLRIGNVVVIIEKG